MNNVMHQRVMKKLEITRMGSNSVKSIQWPRKWRKWLVLWLGFKTSIAIWPTSRVSNKFGGNCGWYPKVNSFDVISADF